MFLSRATIVLTATILGFVHAQTCPSNDNGQCDFDPTNPYACGKDYECAYPKRCLAEAAGYNIEDDCCQAPQPSACGFIFEPLICGSKECPYDNECIASLAGYDPSQCSPAPETCPVGGEDCSGDPSNPYTCGDIKCEYKTTCDVESAGFDIGDDCCQDTRSNTACPANMAPVSCGPPGGKQCGYSNQCLADAAGYQSEQCCNAVPDGIACTMDFAPVECGAIPCVYSNQCQADAAGATGCCKQVPEGIACTADFKPVNCGTEKCEYSNQCLATAAGYQDTECCAAAVTDGCTMEYSPMMCGSASCQYDNVCIATNAGFDSNSCVPITAGTFSADPDTKDNSGSNGIVVTTGLLASTSAAVLGMIM